MAIRVVDATYLRSHGPGEFGSDEIVEQWDVVVDTNNINGLDRPA